MDERPTKRRGPLLWLAARTWRFWGVVVLLPVLYFGSYGPFMRLYFITLNQPAWLKTISDPVYAPLNLAVDRGPKWFHDSFVRYCYWWMIF